MVYNGTTTTINRCLVGVRNDVFFAVTIAVVVVAVVVVVVVVVVMCDVIVRR